MDEQGDHKPDSLEAAVARASVIDLPGDASFQHAAEVAADYLAELTGRSARALADAFLDGTRQGATPVTRGVALPHLRLPEVNTPLMVMVRSREGIAVETRGSLEGVVSHAVFFLVSAERDPMQHLQLLAELARRVEDEHFIERWCAAEGEQQLKAIVLRRKAEGG